MQITKGSLFTNALFSYFNCGCFCRSLWTDALCSSPPLPLSMSGRVCWRPVSMQCPCSAHAVFLQLSLEKQPHTLGQRCHKLAHSASKAVKANFTTFNPTWFHIGFFKIQDQRWPAHPFKSESQSSVSHLTRILSRYMIICSIRSNLMFLSVSRKCTKMLRSWKYFTGSAATPVFLQP